MRRKTKKYIKNVFISNVAGILGALLTSAIASQFTESDALIAGSATVVQYLLCYATFFPLHARDNRDLYQRKDGSFRWRTFGKDMLKLEAASLVLQYAYIIVRPIVHYYFLTEGINPVTASLYADLICIPAYYVFAVPLAKVLGILRDNGSGITFKRLPHKEN